MRPKTLLTPKHRKVTSSSQQDLRPTPTLSEKFAQQDKRNQLSAFLSKTKEVPGGPRSPQKQPDVGGDVPPDDPPAPPPPEPPKKLSMADIIIAASAAKTVKLKTKGEENISMMKILSLFLLAEEVPPPTKNDEAERLVRRMILLTQKGEWDLAVENLKVKPSECPGYPQAINLLVDPGGDGVSE